MTTFKYLCPNCGVYSEIPFGQKTYCSKCIKKEGHERLSLQAIAKYNKRLKDMEDKGI